MMPKRQYGFWVVLCLLISTTQVSAMSLFDFMKVCVFTDVSGVVTLEGKPVAGARIVRTATLVFNGKKFKDETTTDAEGRFQLGAIYARTINKVLPSEDFVDQKVVIYYQDKEYPAWELRKWNYDYNGELNRISSEVIHNLKIIPFALACELTDRVRITKPASNRLSLIGGLCVYQGELIYESNVDESVKDQ